MNENERAEYLRLVVAQMKVRKRRKLWKRVAIASGLIFVAYLISVIWRVL